MTVRGNAQPLTGTSVIVVSHPRGGAHPAPTWRVSDFILIRSVIIARASRGENSPRGAR